MADFKIMNKKNFWCDKKIFITGHTGFKGGWLTVILSSLGAKVSGYSLDPLGKNNFFNTVKLDRVLVNDFRGNILNYKKLKNSMRIANPDLIFHLAAQSSVRESFKTPLNTINTNVLGTANVLELIKDNKNIKSVILVTTDKVYKNDESKFRFNEQSVLGGDDIYSASKSASELIIHAYTKFFNRRLKANIGVVRAGNCIGGGDWTKDRIIRDCIEAFLSDKSLFIRYPNATRPWQHVLEPLSGYINLAKKLYSRTGSSFAGPWNFGPSDKNNMKVYKLAQLAKIKTKSKSKIILKNDNKEIGESINLSLNSLKAFKELKWRPILSVNKALDLTLQWYLNKKKKNVDMLKFTIEQISSYKNIFKK
jgi:CDP-glucose 4,6-dehydratase